MRFESQLSRMYCQIFSAGFRAQGISTARARMVMLAGMSNLADRCHPARSTRRTAWAPGATALAISARCRFIASVLQKGQDQSRALALFRADGTEDIGRCGSLVPSALGRVPRFRPPAGDLVLLADTRASSWEPNFYLAGVDCFFARDFIQARAGKFLKSSMAPSACA